MKTCIKHRIRIAAFTVAVLVAGTACASELVVNGDFSQVLVGWSVGENLGSWLPYQYPDGTISLQPQSQDLGTLVSQTLNVAGIASQAVGVSIDLKADWGHSAGDGVAVYLEYIDSAGDRQRIEALRPDNATVPSGSFSNFSTSLIFPADAVRLVAVTIDKVGDEWMSADNVSVTSPTSRRIPFPIFKPSVRPALHTAAPLPLQAATLARLRASSSLAEPPTGWLCSHGRPA